MRFVSGAKRLLYRCVYALKPRFNGMFPAAGAILWTTSSEALPGDLDLHVSATHLFDPALSPTGGALVLAVSVTQPESLGRLRLANRDPRCAPHIDYAMLTTDRDRRRMLRSSECRFDSRPNITVKSTSFL
ncbi:hypothetical protein QYH69_05425 [Paraburkholderia sp. SARCC-3016]|uniref:hypothetical protein n=1 Tax=Paraburkholderia sp. SARCC-3016 TaxID=3058611 RepID=UPI002808CBD1|nr:hypothetical protein [Paraburkholderia sp. SARCC-3016]MDQ7976683.1 hypothetical protein [Paraburkholderia sp. SARCC-3016]